MLQGIQRQDWRARPETARRLASKLAQRGEIAYWIASPETRPPEGQRADLRKFRFSLKQALEDLKEAGVIHHWAIDASDLVHIERTPSDSQLGHIRKKTKCRKAERAHLNAQSPRNNDWGTGLNQKR